MEAGFQDTLMKTFQLILALIAVSLLAATAIFGEERRPNILFIIVDDQSPQDLKVYNPSSIQDTPNIDRLAAEGMTLNAAHHMGSFSGAVCTPSRHMVMCGRTVWHLPNAPKAKETCPPSVIDNVMAEVFKRAGYDTMRTCKKGNSYGAANEKFAVVHDATKRGGTPETGSAWHCLLYTSPSPRDLYRSRMPSSA